MSIGEAEVQKPLMGFMGSMGIMGDGRWQMADGQREKRVILQAEGETAKYEKYAKYAKGKVETRPSNLK